MTTSSSQALDYLEGLSGAIHKRLYQQPSAVLAVFRRMLPHLGQLSDRDCVCDMANIPASHSEDDSHGDALHDRPSPRYGTRDMDTR